MCQLYSSHKKYLRTVTWLLVAYNSNIVAISESSNNFHEKISHFIFNPLHQIIHVYILYFPVATIQPTSFLSNPLCHPMD